MNRNWTNWKIIVRFTILCWLGVLCLANVSFALDTEDTSQPLVYEGKSGIGVGKHIVFLAGDHEYRSEETLPALARMLAINHGFKCTVLFTVDPKTGEIDPAADNLPGTEVLKDADLAVIFYDSKISQMNKCSRLSTIWIVVGLSSDSEHRLTHLRFQLD